MRFPTKGLPFVEGINLRAVAALNENPLTKRFFSDYLRKFGSLWISKAMLMAWRFILAISSAGTP